LIEAQGWAVLFAIGNVTANTELAEMARAAASFAPPLVSA
jgi:hypothetical protein